MPSTTTFVIVPRGAARINIFLKLTFSTYLLRLLIFVQNHLFLCKREFLCKAGGVHWFPLRLRRQVYGLLGLRVEVFADRTLTIEGQFDADLMHLTPEVEAWVEELRKIDERLGTQEREDPASGYELEVPNPDGRGSSTLHVSARQEQLERELGLLRQRFRTTDTASGCGSPRSRGRCRPQRCVYR